MTKITLHAHWFLKARYLFLRLFFSPWMKVTAISQHQWQQLKDNTHEALIILSQAHSAELIALEQMLKQEGINAQVLVCPKKNKGKAYQLFSEQLTHYKTTHPNEQAWAASIFWGRKPDNNFGIFNAYFNVNWVKDNAIRRLITLIVQSRHIHCQVNALNIQTHDIITAVHDIRDMQKESVIGPDLSHRRTLLKSIVRSDAVQRCINELAEDDKAKLKLQKKSEKYLHELASDYSYAALRFFDILLTWLWQKLYRGINITGFDKVIELSKTHQIVYVPCHRSHMDYLLFSYSIYYQGLPPPHIAAGINLNIPIVGSLLRRGGAFFIRRQFKDNPLYKAVLEAYLHEMFNQGFSLEYFIEGGRSRTGFLLPPKPGMLAMSLRAAISSEKNVAFIPVYIGYERLVESHSYIKELYGKDKQSESLGGVIQAAKYLKENFGQVHLNIGEAIFSDQAFDHAREESNNPSNDSQLVFHGVNWLGENILKNINASAIVTPTNLIATALLSSKQQALLKHQLGAQISLLLNITKQFNYRCSEAHTDEHAINHWIHSAQDKQSIQVRQNPWGDICYLDQSARISSTYLRNNCLHIFILPSLVATLITRNKRIRRKQLGLICHRLLPFIQSELFLTLNQDTLDTAIESSLRLFEKQGMISFEGNTIIACDEERESFYQLSLLAGISKAAIERFYIASQCLLYPEHHEDNGKRLSYHTQETLLHACMIRAEQLSLLHSFHAPDFFDKNLFKSFIEQLIKQGIISTQDSQALIPDHRLKNALKLANFVLPIDTQRSIKQLGRNDD